MTNDMLHVMKWHNGDCEFRPFSDAEMKRRQASVRDWMVRNDVGAVLFTSQHCINYFSGWLYCAFGRKHGMVLTHEAATTISSGIDGGRPWRRGFGDNVTYTDWRRDNFYRAVRQLTAGVQRLGVEFDHVSLDLRRLLEAALPGVELVDVGLAAMWMRTVKSDEELALIRTGAAICRTGVRAAVDCMADGIPEYEVAATANMAMIREIGARFPTVEPMDTWTWFQSGINTDGAHNPSTNRRIGRGDILSLTCCPMIFGYFLALGRTMFFGHADGASLDVWQKTIAVHRRGLDLIRPGARCNEIAAELNDMYRAFGLLKHRSFGYGHSYGVLSQHYGREAAVELREDVITELQPGMVVSMEPMVMLPKGMAGAGGYREHDVLIVTADGAEKVTDFPIGPDHNIIRG